MQGATFKFYGTNSNGLHVTVKKNSRSDWIKKEKKETLFHQTFQINLIVNVVEG